MPGIHCRSGNEFPAPCLESQLLLVGPGQGFFQGLVVFSPESGVQAILDSSEHGPRLVSISSDVSHVGESIHVSLRHFVELVGRMEPALDLRPVLL